MKLMRSFFVLCLIVASVTGCKKPDGRMDVAGTVTKTGSDPNIKLGFISFTPDSSKKGSGPQGFAIIRDGKFDTRADKGKGISPGPLKIEISGYDGVSITEDRPYGKPVCKPQVFSQTIDQSNFDLKFEVSN